MTMLTGIQLETLRAMHEDLRATRPEPRTAARHAHDALYDAMSGVIALGAGSLTAGRDFRDAAASLDKAVRAA